jgi:hypothetical protein
MGEMTTVLKLFILSFCLCAQVKADMLNYKNIHALGGVICHKFQKNKQDVYLSKLNVDRNELRPNHFEFNLSGTCNAKATKEKITSLGEELSISFEQGKSIAVGKLGLKDIKIYFKKGEAYKMQIIDTLFNQKLNVTLTNSKWSKDNMIFTTTPIKIQNGKRAMATETSSKLLFAKNHFQIFNIWNYESYGCTQKLSQTQCEKLVKRI